jgi:hypothetical protein
MDSYTVVWLRDSEADLAALWLDSHSRDSIPAAMPLLERKLREAPQRYGSHVSEGLWKIYCDPLKAYFSIREADRIVEVSNVRLIPPDELALQD